MPNPIIIRRLVSPVAASGGGGLPTDGLLAWWKADALDQANGSNVTLWPDSSGNGHPADPPGTPPTFQTAVIGTKPVVRFAGAGTFLNFFPTDIIIPVNGDFTIFWVSKLLSDSICLGYTGDNVQIRNRSGSLSINYPAGGANHESGSYAAFGVLTDVQVNTFRRLGTAGDFRFNKHTLTSSYTDGASIRVNRIGGTQTGIGNNTNGDLGEIAIYNKYINDADFDAIYDNYLKVRWTTLP